MTKPKALYDFTAEEQAGLPYEELCALRQEEYERRMAKMDIQLDLLDWADHMAGRHGERVFVHRIEILEGRRLRAELFAFDWLTALMIVRWGQEASKWPQDFAAEDIQRALEWEKGLASGGSFRVPGGVTYPLEGEL